MTPQHPAAPETETDANGRWLTDAEDVLLAEWWVSEGGDHEDLALDSLATVVERIVAERVRVVEGERDAARARVEEVVQLNTEKARHVRQLMARLAEVAQVAEERGNEVQAQRDRAESAEAAHEAEKAAHERLRAGIWAVGESIHGDEGVEHVEGCEGEPTCFACILDTLRSLLGGGEAR